MLRFLFMLVVTAITSAPFAPFAPFAPSMPFMPFARQADSTWTVRDVTPLVDPLNHYDYELSYVLSPDGSMLGWMERQHELCMLALPSKVTQCRALPEDYTELLVLGWSPDNQYLLLSNGIGEFSSRHYYMPETDHFGSIDEDDRFSSNLIWNPSDSAAVVYYLTERYEENVASSLLHRYSITTGQDTLFDLKTLFDTPLRFESVIPVSSDGAQFVFFLYDAASPTVPAGLWQADIAAARISQLVTLGDLRDGLPAAARSSFDYLDIIWDQERNRLLVTNFLPQADYPTFKLTSIDLKTGAVLPVLTTEDALTLTGSAHFLDGFITPDGAFFFYRVAADQKAVFALPLSTVSTRESHPLEPIMLMEDFSPGCPRTSLLVTLGSGEIEKTYLYEPRITCR